MNHHNYLTDLFSRYKFPVTTELQLLDAMEQVFIEMNFPYWREYQLTKRDRLDFASMNFSTSKILAIEVKVIISEAKILHQLKRYADHALIGEVILVSVRPIALPPTLSGKSLSNIALWKNLL